MGLEFVYINFKNEAWMGSPAAFQTKLSTLIIWNIKLLTFENNRLFLIIYIYCSNLQYTGDLYNTNWIKTADAINFMTRNWKAYK